MIRPSKAVTIIKSELEAGLVKKVLYDNLIEYWVYQTQNSGTIDGGTGLYTPATASVESGKDIILKCIVMCENKPEHIVKDLSNHFLIQGYIINNTETSNLDEYLEKTGRNI